MKKLINIVFNVLLCILLLVLTVCTLTVFLKSPMMLSAYSSLLTSQYNSQFVFLGLVLLLVCFLLIKSGKYSRLLLKCNLILSILFFVGQIAFLIVMFSTARKYKTEVSFFKGLKGPGKELKSNETYLYLTIYGEKQLLDVFRPKVKSSKPSIPVIMVHGGAFVEGNKTQIGDAAQWFMDRGYTVFSINYPLGKDDRHTWESAVNSLATAMSFVTKNSAKFNVDSEKMLLMGGSAGAGLVMQADLGLRNGYVKSYNDLQPKVPAGVIAIYPPVNLSELWKKMEEGKTIDLKDAVRKYMGGSPSEFPQRFKQLNLTDQLSKGISPTIIVAGEIDHVVSVEETRVFVKKTEEMKLPVSFVEVPYGEHVFDGNSNSISGQIKWGTIEKFLKDNRLEN